MLCLLVSDLEEREMTILFSGKLIKFPKDIYGNSSYIEVHWVLDLSIILKVCHILYPAVKVLEKFCFFTK